LVSTDSMTALRFRPYGLHRHATKSASIARSLAPCVLMLGSIRGKIRKVAVLQLTTGRFETTFSVRNWVLRGEFSSKCELYGFRSFKFCCRFERLKTSREIRKQL
jgi:hypothetical protein